MKYELEIKAGDKFSIFGKDWRISNISEDGEYVEACMINGQGQPEYGEWEIGYFLKIATREWGRESLIAIPHAP